MKYQIPEPTALYDYFDCARDLMRLRSYKNRNGYLEYLKLIQTGKLDFFDYGVGFFTLSIRHYIDVDKHFVRIAIITIDDGDMGAWSKELSEEKAEQLARRIAEYIFENMVAFPTLEELNTQLRPYGMYITHE